MQEGIKTLLMAHKNKVTQSAFIDWFLNDSEVSTNIMSDLISGLEVSGMYITSIQKLFDNCGYIPSWICEDTSTEEEYSSEEVELIDDITYLDETSMLRSRLADKGYYTNNLWSTDDVSDDDGVLSEEDKMFILDKALRSEWVMEQIFLTIDDIKEIFFEDKK